ncbi:uncharacterized protein JCM15063_003016 [Sporobolomyces koalae]|uniref:uncharacterized protein n=1 Tax=Sporobolomyces koalae TaxID=500713 RepID=UPI003174275E
MLQEHSAASLALREVADSSSSTRVRRTSPASSPALRQTRSAFQLSPRLGSTTSTPSSPTVGFFGWSKWYKAFENDEKYGAASANEADEVVVTDQVTNLFKAALEKRKQRQQRCDSEPAVEQVEEMFAWPQHVNDSARTSISSSAENATVSSLDYDELSSSFEYSPPRRGREPVSHSFHASSTAALRSTQSNVTLKAPQLLRRVSSSSVLAVDSVELPPQSPHSSSFSSPTLSCETFPQSPTLLSYSTTSSLSSDSTASSSSTITSSFSSATSSSAGSSRSDASSFRSRISSLRKAVSSTALNFFVTPGPAPPLPPTASVLLRDVLYKNDQSFPSPPLESQPFPTHRGSSSHFNAASHRSSDESCDLESPSSAFPPFDPFAQFSDSTRPFAPAGSIPLSPQPRVLARQRSFIDPKTRSLRTAPSLLCTPPTPDKYDNLATAGGNASDGGGSSGSGSGSGGESDAAMGGAPAGRTIRTRRKRGKRKHKSVRGIQQEPDPSH